MSMPALPAPSRATTRMEKRLKEVMGRVREKLRTVSGDSGSIRLDPKQTKLAMEAYDEHSLDAGATQEMFFNGACKKEGSDDGEDDGGTT